MSYFQYVQKDEDELRQILSTNIRAARKSRHLTQTQLALRADLSLSYMTDIERCKTWVSDKTLANIARALGVDPWELLRPAKEERPVETAEKIDRSETVWQGVREIKRQILIRINKAIAETLEEYREKDKPPAC
ncbi:MAG: helix-turn-helix domain-containing protein [Treponema sp.]|jgi:transcriptional regulator with XRE-family HTH domain|nr:helix-turn-helix domain-containing protein [Treponema sp.]